MNKVYYLIVLASMLTSLYIYSETDQKAGLLQQAPQMLKSYNEIAVVYPQHLADLYNAISPAERIMAYYLFRAGLVANRILTDQHHRYGLMLQDIFQSIYKNKELIEKELGAQFIQEAQTYLVYLWANHGPYFKREHAYNKRTPRRLGLSYLNQENLLKALSLIKYSEDISSDTSLTRLLFEDDFEHTLVVTGNIEKSAVNIYDRSITNNLYQALTQEQKSRINASYKLNKETNQAFEIIYKIGQKYGVELEVAAYWLQKAFAHAQLYPQYFDNNFTQSLKCLITFLHTGDEDDFKSHSRFWLKSSSRIDYTFGFIETYDDPMETTGLMQAEVSIKNYALDKLSAILPSIESSLPIPDKFKRENMSVLPNASINSQLFGAGDLGPLKMTLAYCLPNYSELRSQVGSKQIIYPAAKSLANLLNPSGYVDLFYTTDQAAWIKKHDPDMKILMEIENLQTILHETVGHGSGRLDVHIGDNVPLNSNNLSDYLRGYEGALEELRAEIIALYVSVFYLDQLINIGFFAGMLEHINKEDLVKWLINIMSYKGIKRLLSQADNAQSISGHHAQANTTIMNYLLEAGALEVISNNINFKNKDYFKDYNVISVSVKNLEKAKEAITQLLQEVQRIKSTGDGQAAAKLIGTYGIRLKNPEWIAIMKKNHKALVGDLSVSATLYPFFTPVYDQANNLVDITAEWPKDIFQQYMYYDQIALCKE